MVLELVSGADFRCVLHHLSSLTRLKGSWGQVWPENNPKLAKDTKPDDATPQSIPFADAGGGCDAKICLSWLPSGKN